MLATSGNPGAAAATAGRDHGSELIVGFDPSASARARGIMRAAAGVRLERVLGPPGVELVTTSRGNARRAFRRLERQRLVRYAEPNRSTRPAAAPDDPLWPRQWPLRPGSDGAIDAPRAWDMTTGSRDVVVAVVDTGVDPHPDLEANLWRNPGESGAGREANGIDDDGNGYVDDWRGWDFEQRDNSPVGGAHGTHVAGVIGAVGGNGAGVAGVSHRVSILPLYAYASVADEVEAFAYAHRAGARILNGSFGSSGRSQALEDAIAAAPRTLFVFSAGNSAADQDALPPHARYHPCASELPNVVCVAASDAGDALAGFSNFGSSAVDLAAPGVDVLGLGVTEKVLFEEDFDEPLDGRWVVGGTGGTWARSPEAAYCCGQGLADSPGGDYGPDVDSWAAVGRTFDLRGHSDCSLVYRVRHELAPGDVLRSEASADGSAWTVVGEHRGSSQGEGPPTFHRDWDTVRQDLATVEGTPAARVRLRLTTDSSGSADGAAVDDVFVGCDAVPYRGDEYAVRSGTSFAAPHVAGAATLLLARRPELTPVELRAALLASVDRRPQLEGRVASGGRLNVRAALDAISGGGAAVSSPVALDAAGPVPGAIDLAPERAAVPRCTVTMPSRVRVTTLARGRLVVTARCPARTRVEVAVRAIRTTRRLLRVRASAVVARAARTVPVGGRVRLAVRPTRGLARRLRGLPAGTFRVTVIERAAAGARTLATRRLRVR